MVPSGKELLNIIHLSVFLSTCRGQVREQACPLLPEALESPFFFVKMTEFHSEEGVLSPSITIS